MIDYEKIIRDALEHLDWALEDIDNLRFKDSKCWLKRTKCILEKGVSNASTSATKV